MELVVASASARHLGLLRSLGVPAALFAQRIDAEIDMPLIYRGTLLHKHALLDYLSTVV
jgi:predicted house-cleaning NTP pyrophosphatase (Maf/HAM1 superfamily)